MEFRQNVDLQPYNSMAIPAKADFLAEVASIAELNTALDFAAEQGLPILVLGEGSNTIFRQHYHGLVILNRLLGVEVLAETASHIELQVNAGENWHALVQHTVENGWYGLQNLALIPGLVGAAPMQNIGAYGVELSNVVAWVEYLDIATRETKRLDNSECDFAYRESRFKRDLAGKVIITAISLVLSKRPTVNVSYPALQALLGENASPEEIFEVVCDVRRAKLPMPSDIPNAGSFFKNPVVDVRTHAKLKQQYPSMVSFKVNGAYKLAAGWMIEFCGWKQQQIDGVAVHQAQALVIINPERRPGSQVLNFARAVQADIKEVFGVELEIEPRIHG